MKEKISNILERKGDILRVAFLAIVITWIICFLVDYTRVRKSIGPLFCIKNEIKTYSDGEVRICTGLGYKSYQYNRRNINARIEFGPFFIKERTE